MIEGIDFGTASDGIGIPLLLLAFGILIAGDLHPASPERRRKRIALEILAATSAVALIATRFYVML